MHRTIEELVPRLLSLPDTNLQYMIDLNETAEKARAKSATPEDRLLVFIDPGNKTTQDLNDRAIIPRDILKYRKSLQ